MTPSNAIPEDPAAAPGTRIRRVVTGHDESGKAVVVSDEFAGFVHTVAKRPGYASTDIWRTASMPATIVARSEDPTPGPRRQMPGRNGTVLRINTWAPEPEAIRNLRPDQVQEVFADMGNQSASTFASNGRHPMMHRTETIDYAIVLSGELTMLLDDSEVVLHAGDIVVQCGTNHAWSNRGTVPCQVAFVLIDGEFEPSLAATLHDQKHAG
jgi:mannose-6-phosphate isomerase-like protein (cupin superfamily)